MRCLRTNSLPDPLVFFDGKLVKTAADWKLRRTEILELYQKWVWGKVPPLPKFDHAEVQDAPASGYRTRTGKIFCGPGGQGSIRITMQISDGPGPFPVVMGPGLVGGFGRASAEVIRRHGYVVCSIAANDGNDDSVKLASLYPECDPGGAVSPWLGRIGRGRLSAHAAGGGCQAHRCHWVLARRQGDGHWRGAR